MTALRDAIGPYYGGFGGRYVPESLIAALDELESAYLSARQDPEFQQELARLHRDYTGRPSIITEATRYSEYCGGARIFLKREDLNHTGSHKINNVIGQALLAKRIGKTRIIAERGLVNTVWQVLRLLPSWGWTAWSTWERSTPSVKR